MTDNQNQNPQPLGPVLDPEDFPYEEMTHNLPEQASTPDIESERANKIKKAKSPSVKPGTPSDKVPPAVWVVSMDPADALAPYLNKKGKGTSKGKGKGMGNSKPKDVTKPKPAGKSGNPLVIEYPAPVSKNSVATGSKQRPSDKSGTTSTGRARAGGGVKPFSAAPSTPHKAVGHKPPRNNNSGPNMAPSKIGGMGKGGATSPKTGIKPLGPIAPIGPVAPTKPASKKAPVQPILPVSNIPAPKPGPKPGTPKKP